MKKYCTNEEALKVLEGMNDKEFNTFLDKCPARVRLLVKGRVVDWKKVLPEWYATIPF